jgi:ATP-binding cassette subfamily B protein
MLYYSVFFQQHGQKPDHPLEHVSVRRVLALFRPYGWQAALVLLCIIVSAMLSVVPAYLISLIIDRGILGRDVQILLELTALALGIIITNGFIGVLQNYLSNLVGQRITADLRARLYQHMLALSVRFFSRTKLGDLMSRFNNDIGGIQNTVTNTYISVVGNSLTLIVTAAFMLLFNWPLTLVAFIVVPAFVIPTRRVGRIRRDLSLATQETLSQLGSHLRETLDISGVLLIKNFVRQRYEFSRFSATNDEVMRLQVRQSIVGRWLAMFISVFVGLGPILICLVAGLEYAGYLPGHISIGAVVTFISLLNRLYSPATQLAGSWVSIQSSAALFDRIFEMFDEPVEIQDAPHAIVLPPARGEIAFDHVDFSYISGRPALRDVSFVAPPGQLVALVGHSGAGKSTIISLIPRWYDVTNGAIRIDGQDVRDVQLASLGEQIGMVTQETYLFHASVRDNIAYGRIGATEEEIVAAAKAAYIHDFILGLPEGYDTIVGERGFKLSGGEKQRIAIARVILKNPRILILDEATSSLDSQSEAYIQAALQPVMQQRTTVVIAHRLSTILAAHQILVLQQGAIVERGRHHDLLALDGVYARLYHEQFKAETERMASMRATKVSD